MPSKIIWLSGFMALYAAYGVFIGVRCARTAKTASDYFISGRSLPAWAFILTATAVSFSGWIFIEHAGLVFRDGFQYAYVSLCAIGMPLAGVLFLKRQWMLGKHFGYVTPCEMLSDYFQSGAIRFFVLGVALLFSVPYLGVQLAASGLLFSLLTDGAVSANAGMWILSAVMLFYAAAGGLRAVAQVAPVQCVLLAAFAVAAGLAALDYLGGFGGLQASLAKLASSSIGEWGMTKGHGGADYNAYFATPGTIQFTAGLGKETPAGGPWTGVMNLTYLFAFMGMQAAPAFTMLAFSAGAPRAFAPQQVFASSIGAGAILLFFIVFQGAGAHFLGASRAANEAGLALAKALPELASAAPENLAASYLNAIASQHPWLSGLLAACVLAAMHAAGAAYMSTASGMLARDVYKRYFNPDATDKAQITAGRLGAAGILGLTLLMAAFGEDAMAALGGLALAIGFQMWPSLAAATWLPWITRQGAIAGLTAGVIAAALTENIGASIVSLFGLELSFGRWPWTIHSAGWGMIFNVLFCVIVSAMTQNGQDHARRMRSHDFLDRHASLPREKHWLKPAAWTIVLGWLFFGAGPGAVIGNDAFGAPGAGLEGWLFGIPSIWAWQILFWVIGIGMIWLLAYKMEMSMISKKAIMMLTADRDKTS